MGSAHLEIVDGSAILNGLIHSSRISVLAVLAAFSGSASAAEALTWQSCVELTARQNPEVRSARETYSAAVEQVGVARSSFLPQADGSLTYANGESNNNAATHTYNASIAVSQNLFNGLIDKARLEQARYASESAQESLISARSKVSYDLRAAFEGMSNAKDYRQLTGDIIDRRASNLKLVSLRFDSGRENKGSVMLSQAYLEQARYDDLQARNNLVSARTQLARTLGRDDDDAVDVQGHVPTNEPPASAPDYRALVQATPDFKRALANEASSEAGVTVARGGFFPTLGLSGTAGKQGESWFPDTQRWTLGVTLGIPLFSGGSSYYATRSARENYRASASTRENSGRQLQSDLTVAFNSYVEAVAKLKVDDSFQKAAEVRANIARNKYNNGLLSFDDWDIIENDLINRQKSYLQSRLARVVAEAAWERAQGKGVIP